MGILNSARKVSFREILDSRHWRPKGPRQSSTSFFYTIDEKPGISPKEAGVEKKYAYLDDLDIQNRLLDFKDKNISRVTFYIPSMHCSSCVWLLESLYRFYSFKRLCLSTLEPLKNLLHLYEERSITSHFGSSEE